MGLLLLLEPASGVIAQMLSTATPQMGLLLLLSSPISAVH
jgi:hypothetical protein